MNKKLNIISAVICGLGVLFIGWLVWGVEQSVTITQEALMTLRIGEVPASTQIAFDITKNHLHIVFYLLMSGLMIFKEFPVRDGIIKIQINLLYLILFWGLYLAYKDAMAQPILVMLERLGA